MEQTVIVTEQPRQVVRGCAEPTAALLKLLWTAQRARRCERIRRELAAGTYHVDSEAVARSLLNLDPDGY